MVGIVVLKRGRVWASSILLWVLALFPPIVNCRISPITGIQFGSGDGTFAKRERNNDPNGYAPPSIDCPNSRPTVQNSTSLSSEETDWLEKRRANTVWAIRDFLTRANISGFDTNAYVERTGRNASTLPIIAIAVTGGGYRALMHGAGVISAFDNRTSNSTLPGNIGGLLQASTYLSGVSGRSWLVGSLYIPKLRPVQEILRMDPNATDPQWQFYHSIIEGPTTLSVSSYYTTIMDEMNNNGDAGLNTTITDLWGRGLSFQLFNAPDGGPGNEGYIFSGIAQDLGFQSASEPLPIVVALEQAPNQLLIPLNSTVYEISPWEIGTFEPPTAAFASLQYVGSNFRAGTIPETENCISGFDNACFVLTGKLEEIGRENNDVSNWVNPFYQYKEENNTSAKSKILSLVDGGEDLQNIPLYPLLQPLRKVDVIFAVDGSADTAAPGAYWSNGTALVATYQRSLLKTGHELPFPSIPDPKTFINLSLNSQPTFFGCDTKNLTELSPLIVYIPNYPYTYTSNIWTFQLETNDTERNWIIQNGYNVATRGNGTLDKDWPSCIGCAIHPGALREMEPKLLRLDSTAPPPYVPTHAIKSSGCPRRAEVTISVIVAACFVALSLLF
ncbi:hypothetical protein K469DRAFT_726844 [Zopfia rhizophila CBS 207.26]|uniref:Lysophospholipase n=1 Tax=Zopfia rhizophila CBS 207.26 TaxID=1314779 RepID=A0A6A6E057_9PEZI|nr:hypothetical protein K469DRAFT_726844 [Zopfia rhizophila CBS 207.26]